MPAQQAPLTVSHKAAIYTHKTHLQSSDVWDCGQIVGPVEADPGHKRDDLLQ